MADIHMVNFSGSVEWFQNWTPQAGKESWGGTLAMRIKPLLHDAGNGHLVNQKALFVRVKYRQKDFNSKRLSYIINALTMKEKNVAITDGKLVWKERKGKWECSLQASFNNFNLIPVGRPLENLAVIMGQCTSHKDPWMQVSTGYRNPKAQTIEYRQVNVYAPSAVPPLENKWVYVRGKVLTVSDTGEESPHVYADLVV